MDEAKGVGTILRAYASLVLRYPHCPPLWLVGESLPMRLDRPPERAERLVLLPA